MVIFNKLYRLINAYIIKIKELEEWEVAMMKCPECGKESSDEFKQCAHCGCQIENAEVQNAEAPSVENLCNDTGAVAEEAAVVQTEEKGKAAEPQQPAYSGSGAVKEQPEKKLPLKIIILCAAVLLIALVIIFASVSSARKKEDQYKQAVRYQNRGQYEDAIEIYQDLGGYEDAADCVSYCEALILLNSGDYEGAYDVLTDIPEYEGAQSLLKQIYYETKFFEGINDLKKYLKNPDSLTVKNVEFHYYPEEVAEENNPTIDAPVCIVMESAQNGFGGFSSAYALLTYNDDNEAYQYVGSVDSLNEDDYDLTDTDEMYDWILCSVIQDHREQPEIEGAVDLDRIGEIISNGKYSNIKAIKSLTIDDFADALFTDSINVSVESAEDA